MKNFQTPEGAVHIKSREDFDDYVSELKGIGKRPNASPDRYPCLAVLAGSDYDNFYLDTAFFVYLYPEEPTIFAVVRKCGFGDERYGDIIFAGLDGEEAKAVAESLKPENFPHSSNQWILLEEWQGKICTNTTCYEPET